MQGALAHYRRAVEADPEHAEAHGNLGAILEEIGLVGGAILHYRRAVELRPRHAAQGRLDRLRAR